MSSDLCGSPHERHKCEFGLLSPSIFFTSNRKVKVNFLSGVRVFLKWNLKLGYTVPFRSVLDDFMLAEDFGLVDEETKQLRDLLNLAKDALVSDPQQFPIQLSSRLAPDHPRSKDMIQQALRPNFPCLVSSHCELKSCFSVWLTERSGFCLGILPSLFVAHFLFAPGIRRDCRKTVKFIGSFGNDISTVFGSILLDTHSGAGKHGAAGEQVRRSREPCAGDGPGHPG